MSYVIVAVPSALAGAVCLGLGMLLGTILAERHLLQVCRVCQARRRELCESCAQRDIGELAAQAELDAARDDAIES